MGDQFSLVVSGSIKFASVYVPKELANTEVSDDLTGKYCRLRSYDKQSMILSRERRQSNGDLGVESALEHSFGDEALSVKTDRLLNEGSIVTAKQCYEAVVEGRSNVLDELLFRRFLAAKLFERILKTANDSLTRIAESAIQVEH